MRWEQFSVPDQRPVWVCGIPHTGQLLQNTGNTELLVGMGNYEASGDLTADNGLKVAPGTTITWPPHAAVGAQVSLYAVSPGGVGQITYADFRD